MGSDAARSLSLRQRPRSGGLCVERRLSARGPRMRHHLQLLNALLNL